MNDPQTVDILVQAGAVGLALVALALCGYTVKVLTNHLAHVADILIDLSSSIRELVTIVKFRD